MPNNLTHSAQARRLVAIMFTDIVGYTAQMGKNEAKALEILSENKAIHTRLIGQFNGTLIKEMGDGMLISFNISSDAVRCAVEIQKASKEVDIPLKIGIHEGEVLFKESDVLGDSVNLASRIQDSTEAGGITVSESVYRNIRNKSGIETSYLGEKTFKNVDDPIRVYSVLIDKTPDKSETKPGPLNIPNNKSIVVIPFINMSPDAEQEYFCDGIAEDIINALTHISELKVIARTSSFSFKNQNMDVREIGRKLDVNYLLEGSVRKGGNRLRITAQLINLSDGTHLYSERFDREMDDIFEIQDEITAAIVDKLKLNLLNSEKEALLRRYTENVEVYTTYLLGRYHNYKFTVEDADKAKKYFDDALKIDPKYVPAYVGLCLYYLVLGGAGLNILPPKEAIPKAKKACQMALKIDPDYAEAHANLSVIYNMYELEWEKGEYHAKRAIELEPKNAEAQRHYAWDLTFQGKPGQAVEKIKEAINLDPLQALTYQNAATHNYFARDYDMAIKYAEKTLSMNPYFEIIKISLGMALLQKAKYEEGIRILKNMTSYPGLSDSYLGYAYGITEKNKEAYEILVKLDQFYAKGLVSASGIALTHLGLGNYEKTIELVELSLSEKPAYSWHTAFIHVDPIWDPIREEPAFQRILLKIGKKDSSG